ncbi:serine hydroxymethyltransferase, partial [Striga asiatica]
GENRTTIGITIPPLFKTLAMEKLQKVVALFPTNPSPVNLDTDNGFNVDFLLLSTRRATRRSKRRRKRAYAHKRFHKVRQKVILLADMAHISRLVTAGGIPSPFDYVDVINNNTNHFTGHAERWSGRARASEYQCPPCPVAAGQVNTSLSVTKLMGVVHFSE